MRPDFPKIFQKSLLALPFLVLLGNFKCADEFDNGAKAFVKFRDFRPTWLDNRGSAPVVATGDTVLRAALGIRLAAILSDAAGERLNFLADSFYLVSAVPELKKIEILATEGFDDVAAGSDISSRFRGRVDKFGRVRYVSLDEWRGEFNSFEVESTSPFFAGNFTADLLMVEPPSAAGAFRCGVRVEFEPNDAVSRDTFFELPFIFLK